MKIDDVKQTKRHKARLDFPMQITAYVSEKHYAFIKKYGISMSKFFRKALDELMEGEK